MVLVKCLRDVDKYVIVLCDRVASELQENVSEAASKKDGRIKVRRLVEQGGNVNDVDRWWPRRTALHWAAWHGKSDICSLAPCVTRSHRVAALYTYTWSPEPYIYGSAGIKVLGHPETCCALL